jgi:hypothetical protein
VTVGTLFGHAAWDYDRARRQLVPGFDRFYGAVLENIPFGEQQEIRVLDLGAGTSLLSAVVAGTFPRARVTLVAQLAWLGEAGFEGIGCRYKDHRFAVYNGRKRHENGKDADG